MLEILKSILYGIVEGITEWLPVSSTGHLIILDEVLPLKVSAEFSEMFTVVIQLGAILAVLLLFFHKLNPFSPKKDEKQKAKTWNLWFKVVVAALPSAVLGLLLDDWMDEHLYNHVVVAITLIGYGVAIMYIENRNRGKAPRVKTVYGLSYKDALLIGAFQCLALIPGTSRSGSTILGAMMLGVGRSAGSEFSFFLAIPTMVGASLLKVVKFIGDGISIGGTEIAILLVGCVVAFFVSLLVVNALMEYVRKHSFAVFGVYRIALGILVLLYFLVTRLLF